TVTLFYFLSFSLFVTPSENTLLLINTNNQVKKNQEKINKLEILLSEIKDAEIGQQTYILTGEELHLQPYQLAVANVEREFIVQLESHLNSVQTELTQLGILCQA
ncbi:CHASE3 domain-containing protein, partial [Anabaena sp. CCY 9910]|uniref:CHASE3 domain-containing protein n=1 Tax=Anabaena sp. CCY 9910 TaxID=3103870 RepID=UPI0039DF7FF1